MERLAYANYAVIAVTCWFSYQGFKSSLFEQKYIFWPEAILAEKQFYRLVTSGFLHANGIHLAANMMTLCFFGPVIRMTNEKFSMTDQSCSAFDMLEGRESAGGMQGWRFVTICHRLSHDCNLYVLRMLGLLAPCRASAH
jgi:hypothetical protein